MNNFRKLRLRLLSNVGMIAVSIRAPIKVQSEVGTRQGFCYFGSDIEICAKN